MKQSRIASYADFLVYPALVAVMMVVIADTGGAVERAVALSVALTGVLLWTLLEYSLHRKISSIPRCSS
jgi:hypothetical protein